MSDFVSYRKKMVMEGIVLGCAAVFLRSLWLVLSPIDYSLGQFYWRNSTNPQGYGLSFPLSVY